MNEQLTELNAEEQARIAEEVDANIESIIELLDMDSDRRVTLFTAIEFLTKTIAALAATSRAGDLNWTLEFAVGVLRERVGQHSKAVKKQHRRFLLQQR